MSNDATAMSVMTGMRERDRAAVDQAYYEEFRYTRIAGGCAVSPGMLGFIQALERDEYDSLWLTVDVTTWVMQVWLGEFDSKDQAPSYMHVETFSRLLAKWLDSYRQHQGWAVRRNADGTADICLGGGSNLTEDDSMTLYPIQRYPAGLPRLPWGKGETVWGFYVEPWCHYSPEDHKRMLEIQRRQMEWLKNPQGGECPEMPAVEPVRVTPVFMLKGER